MPGSAAYIRAWREANREHVRTYNREYERKRRAANPGADRAAKRKWRRKHPDYPKNRRWKLKFAAWAATCARSRHER